MNAPRLLFGPVGTSADTGADTSPRRTRLTSRGEFVAAAAIFVALFLALWGASALGYAYTGVPG